MKYVIKKVGTMIFTLCIVCFLIFGAFSMIPGDPALSKLGTQATESSLNALREEMGFKLTWDGACGADKIKKFAPKGVDGFVLGTTLLFGKNRPYGDILKEIRELKL